MTLAYFLIVQLAFHNSIYGQKKWDGGGGDSLWINPNNWQPNGVPESTDTVVLDNQWVLSSYRVLLPDSTVAVSAYSIRIQPAQNHQINLIIPTTNTAAPALTLSALDTAIYIGEGGCLISISGASAGNAIVLSGKFKIANGGKYIHQTLRGNALLISNLVSSPETVKGIFEFNVPGNSAYTISASGRSFGTLVLNGQNTIRKTYTSSGINKLTIEGDFIIKEQAGFSSSLTNTISIGGDLIVNGRLYINPISGDTVGRSVVSTGIGKIISITGLFNQGVHFRKWIITGSYRMVNSTIPIEHPSGIFQFTTGSYIDMGTSIIKGVGKVIVDSNTIIATSARTIVGADSMSNLQTEQLYIHHKVGFICYGTIAQSIGERFPSSISSLHIVKSNEQLNLIKSITVNDSLLLRKGILTLPDTTAITIGNYVNQGNDSSYVAGSVIHSSKRLELIFPIGIDSLFAPVSIMRSTDSLKPITIKVNRFSSIDSLPQTHPPVEKITSKIYWTIIRPDSAYSAARERLEIRNNFNEKSNCIAVFDNVDNTWKLAENSTATPNSNVLSTHITVNTNSRFTIGKLVQHALPLNNIFLKQVNSRDEITLHWTVNDDENAQYYLIEQSKEGSLFVPKDTVVSIMAKGQVSYKKTVKPAFKNTSFFRVSGVDLDENRYYSNIVHVQSKIIRSTVYPNPSTNKMYIKTNQKIIGLKIIHPDGKFSPIIPVQDSEGYYIMTRILPVGNYFLRIKSASGLETITFMKQ
jgi:hypothetical protein